jgi:hypothetical protein
MNNVTHILSVSAVALALAAGAAQAAPDETRERVQAELVAAQQTGELAYGNQGMTLREMYPERYSRATATDAAPDSAAPVDNSTRDQELASLTAAARAGEISVEDVRMIMHELYPAPSEAAAASGGIADEVSTIPAY